MRPKPSAAGLVDGGFDAGRDLVGGIVPDGGKTGEVDMAEFIGFADGQNFTGNRAACDDVNFFRFRAFHSRRSFFHANVIRHNKEPRPMTAKTIATIGLVLFSVTTLASCGNTIRGMGADAANTWMRPRMPAARSIALPTKRLGSI